MVKLSNKHSFGGLLDSLRKRTDEWYEYFKVNLNYPFTLELAWYCVKSS